MQKKSTLKLFFLIALSTNYYKIMYLLFRSEQRLSSKIGHILKVILIKEPKAILCFGLFKLKFSILLFFLIGLISLKSHSQNPNITREFRPNLASYSPNTAAFLKYGDQPVSKYTGIPNISIPVYTISSDNFNLPIELSYHAGGIRVEEEASWVGLGWSLNYGGQISRIIRGREDFGSFGYFTTAVPYKNPNVRNALSIPTGNYPGTVAINGTTEMFTYDDGFYYNISQPNEYDSTQPNGKDGEPDIFSFQAGSYSGKFIIDRPKVAGENYSIRLLSGENRLKITIISNQSFSIITPDGVLYEYAFKDLQKTYSTPGPEVTGQKLYENNNLYFHEGRMRQYTTTWYLSKIVLPNGKIVQFDYKSEDIVSYGRNQTITMNINKPGEDISVDPLGYYTSLPPFMITKSITTQQLIKSIKVDGLEVNFLRSGRNDILTQSGPVSSGCSRLSGIDIYYNGVRFKEFMLGHDYFDAGTGSNDLYTKRLRLTFFGEFNQGQFSRHNFLYNSTVEGVIKNLPEKDAFSQDYWGYYNGKANNVPFLVPNLKEFSLYPQYATDIATKFSDRSVDARYAAIGTLSQITYPTGGITKFVYESNDFSNLQSITTSNVQGQSNLIGQPIGYDTPEPSSPQYYPNIQGGGIRIKKILTYDCDSNKVKETRYEYSNNGVSTGKLMFQMVFHGTDEEEYSYPFPGQGGTVYSKKYVTRVSSNSTYSVGSSAQGSPVGYSNVKEYVNGQLQQESFFENKVEKQHSSFHFGLPQGKTSPPLVYQPQICSYQYIFGPGYSVQPNQKNFSTSNIPNVINYSNGSLLRNVTYKTISGTTSVVEETVYGYDKVDRGYSEGLIEQHKPGPLGVKYVNFFYKIPLSANLLKVKINTRYEGGSAITETTNMSYNADNQLAVKTTKNSRQQTLMEKYFYPQDVAFAPGNFPGLPAATYSQMSLQNQVDQPVRVENYIGTKLINAFEAIYGQVGNVAFTNAAIFKPVTTKEYKEQMLANETTYKYDGQGYLKEAKKNNGTSVSYLWNYEKNYPVAETVNAQATDIAYTSFETDDDGGWTRSGTSTILTDGITGLRSLNGSVSFSTNPAKEYLVSVWGKTGSSITINGQTPQVRGTAGTFNQYELTLSGLSTVTVAGANMDEVRLHPVPASMSTFTFSPFIGMSSRNSANNDIEYYEYDVWERLSITRDRDKNILSRNEYTLRGSVKPCNIFVSKGTQMFLFPQCPSNYNGLPITVTVPEGENYSLISQADADSKTATLAQSMANSQGICVPKLKLNWVQENGGNSITVGFTPPSGSNQYKVYWQDLTYHQYNGEVSVSTTSPAITLPAAGRTYLLGVSANYNGYTISDSRNFTLESFGNVTMSQNFIKASCSCSVAYTVHAGTFTADTQALANQFAQNDINANGQAYVDSH